MADFEKQVSTEFLWRLGGNAALVFPPFPAFSEESPVPSWIFAPLLIRFGDEAFACVNLLSPNAKAVL